MVKKAGYIVEKCNRRDFWAIMDLLKVEREEHVDRSGFYNNRGPLLDAYARGDFYVLHLYETDEVFNARDALKSEGYFLDWTFATLPCFCVINGKDKPVGVEFIWTLESKRGLGFARYFIEDLEVEEAVEVIEESVEFWNHMGVKIKSMAAR